MKVEKYPKQLPPINNCRCGGRALLIYEGLHHNPTRGVMEHHARVRCERTHYKCRPRCYMKTIAGPIKEVIKSWNQE